MYTATECGSGLAQAGTHRIMKYTVNPLLDENRKQLEWPQEGKEELYRAASGENSMGDVTQ